MPEHVTMIENTPDGYLGRCTTCGARNTEFTGYGIAGEWCDQHETDARALRLNRGSTPGLATLERDFREKSQMMVYSPEERAEWARLADELADRTRRHRTQALPGQMDLFTEGDER